MNRELEILKGMTQSTEMRGDRDGWHFWHLDDHKVGPILTHELLRLGEKGLTIRYEGVDRIVVSDKGIRYLQEEGLWPLGPFSDPLHTMLHPSGGDSERLLGAKT